jgi:hypothetical protein
MDSIVRSEVDRSGAMPHFLKSGHVVWELCKLGRAWNCGAEPDIRWVQPGSILD